MNIKSKELTPQLRFPEFAAAGEWVKRSLISTADKKVKWSFTGGPFGSNLQASDYTSNGIRIIQLQNIGDGEFNDAYKIYTSQEKADELLSCNIYAGDIIISKMGDPVGRACMIPDFLERCVMASDGIRLVVDEMKYSKYFIFSLLNSKQTREAIEKKATGSTRKRIGLDDLREIEFVLPKSLSEQQKIAFCLSSLDEVITAHTQKLDALKEHKKGLMQNLFPQEGETVPKYRFPEFKKAENWKEKNLEEVSDIGRGKSKHRPRDASFLYGGKFPFIQTGDIKKAGLYLTDYGQTYSEEGLKQSKLWNEDTLCITIAANIAETAILKIKACFPDSVIGLVPKKDQTDVVFIKFLFDKYKNQLQGFSQGVAQDNLNQERLSKIKFVFPLFTEQQKIANCFLSLERLMTEEAEKIRQLKLYKQGLMQRLFPRTVG